MSLPSTIAIRKCPYCSCIFGSDNHDGFFHITLGMTWTDGDDSSSIQLPDSDLVKCECSKIFNIEDAEIVGLDGLNYEVKNGFMGGTPVEDVFNYLSIPALKGFKGSTLRHNDSSSYDYYLPLPGLPDDCKGLAYDGYRQPSYNEVLENKLYSTPEQKLETRIKIFWSEKYTQSFFDKYRETALKPLSECTCEDNNVLRSFSLSDDAVENVFKLLQLWDTVPEYKSDYLEYRIMRADMFRQLGRFDECLSILNRFTVKEVLPRYDTWTDNSDIINLITQSCKENIRCPRKLESDNSWW